jgi:hypothetical protein
MPLQHCAYPCTATAEWIACNLRCNAVMCIAVVVGVVATNAPSTFATFNTAGERRVPTTATQWTCTAAVCPAGSCAQQSRSGPLVSCAASCYVHRCSSTCRQAHQLHTATCILLLMFVSADAAGTCKLPADAAVLSGGRIQLHHASYVPPHHLLSALAH